MLQNTEIFQLTNQLKKCSEEFDQEIQKLKVTALNDEDDKVTYFSFSMILNDKDIIRTHDVLVNDFDENSCTQMIANINNAVKKLQFFCRPLGDGLTHPHITSKIHIVPIENEVII